MTRKHHPFLLPLFIAVSFAAPVPLDAIAKAKYSERCSARISVSSKPDCEYPVVSRVRSRIRPGQEPKITVGSIITAIDDEDTKLLGERKCLQLLDDGLAGSTVKVTVSENGNLRTLELERVPKNKFYIDIGKYRAPISSIALVGTFKARSKKLKENEFEVPFLLCGNREIGQAHRRVI